MVTDVNEIRTICKNMDNEKLVENFRRYAIQESNRRFSYDEGDRRYDDWKRIFDGLKAELLARLAGKEV